MIVPYTRPVICGRFHTVTVKRQKSTKSTPITYPNGEKPIKWKFSKKKNLLNDGVVIKSFGSDSSDGEVPLKTAD